MSNEENTIARDGELVSRHLTFHRLWLPAMRSAAGQDAVRCGDRNHTYAEHVERTCRIANALGSELGLGRGDRYAVLALNSIEYLELYHAAYLGAAIVNPLNIRLAPKEIAFVLEDSGTKVVFVDATFAPLIEAVRDQVSSLESVILIGPDDAVPEGVRIDGRYEDLIAAGSPDIPPETREDDPCSLMYTGGTTGLPKGVLHTQRSTCVNGQLLHPTIDGCSPSDVFLMSTPMFHAASLIGILAVPQVPATLVIVPMFAPEAVLAAVEQHQVNRTGLVPVMLRMVLDDPGYSPERLRTVRSFAYGASPMPAGLLARFVENHPDIDLVQVYGMTEGLPVTVLDAEAHRAGGAPLRSAGKVVRGFTVQIQNDEGNEVPQGETGEICARSGAYMREYWNRPEATAEAFKDGWYHTGDAGYLDENGYLFLVDRVKDMIVSGGENVYSAEVESAISTHPAVADVAVIGIPSEEWGEAVHAVVVVRPDHDVTEAEIISHAREAIAGYKVPRSVDLREEPLPVSGAGKTLKRALREPFWEGAERNVN